MTTPDPPTVTVPFDDLRIVAQWTKSFAGHPGEAAARAYNAACRLLDQLRNAAETPPADDLRAHLIKSLLASWSVAPDPASKAMATLAAGRDVRTILAALETHEVMADVEDALDYVIETSPHDTTRFRRAHEVLFPNAPKGTDDE